MSILDGSLERRDPEGIPKLRRQDPHGSAEPPHVFTRRLGRCRVVNSAAHPRISSGDYSPTTPAFQSPERGSKIRARAAIGRGPPSTGGSVPVRQVPTEIEGCDGSPPRGSPSRAASRSSSAFMRIASCSFSSRAATTMSRKTSTSSRVAIVHLLQEALDLALERRSRPRGGRPGRRRRRRSSGGRFRRGSGSRSGPWLPFGVTRASPVMWRVRGGPATGLTQAGRRVQTPPAWVQTAPGAAVSGHRPDRHRHRPVRDPLVRARLYRGPRRRLVLCPAPRRGRRIWAGLRQPSPARHRRSDRLGGARRRARRPARLRAVLQSRLLSRAPARDLRGLARRDVVPRRLPRRGARDRALRALRESSTRSPCSIIAAVVTPIGLFFGRIANFINGELWGRPASDVPWAVVFPHAGPGAAPSEPALRGLRRGAAPVRRAGHRGAAASASAGPACSAASSCSAMRSRASSASSSASPIPQLGFLFGASVDALGGGITMGMLLSLPMVLVGARRSRWRCAASRGRASQGGRSLLGVTPPRGRAAPDDRRRRADHGRALHGALPRPPAHGYYTTPRSVRRGRRFRHRARDQPDVRRAASACGRSRPGARMGRPRRASRSSSSARAAAR